MALAWLLTRPGVTSVIVGARTERQLADNLETVTLELPAEELARLEELSRPPLIYPHWHQAQNSTDRMSDAQRSLLGQFLD